MGKATVSFWVPTAGSSTQMEAVGLTPATGFQDAKLRNLATTGTATFGSTATAQTVFAAANGTAGAPSYAFTNDTGLGLYRIGTGQLGIVAPTTTTSAPFQFTQTWNAGAVAFTGLLVNFTSTASAAASKIADLQIGGSTRATFYKTGTLFITDNGNLPSTVDQTTSSFLVTNDGGFGNWRIYNAGSGSGDSAAGPYYIGASSRGTTATPTQTQSGDRCFSILGQGYDGANWQPLSQIDCKPSANVAVNNSPGRLMFLTVPASSSTLSKRWSIEPTGFLQGTSGLVVGWTAAADPTAALDTGLSRDALGVVDFGTGAAASTAGSWKATNGTLLGGLSVGPTAATIVAGQVAFGTGGGNISQILGPTDQPLTLQAGSITAGNNITLLAGFATGATAAGGIACTAGQSATGAAGLFSATGGLGGSTSGAGGSASISGGAGVAGAGGLGSVGGGASAGSNFAAGGLSFSTGTSTGTAVQTILFKAAATTTVSGAGVNAVNTIAQFSRSGTLAIGTVYSFVANATGNALATSAVDGFVYVGSAAGVPAGTPTAFTGAAPITIDTTNNNLYFYSGAAWQKVTGGANSTWAAVLANGATTGAANPSISNGQGIVFRAASATADGIAFGTGGTYSATAPLILGPTDADSFISAGATAGTTGRSLTLTSGAGLAGGAGGTFVSVAGTGQGAGNGGAWSGTGGTAGATGAGGSAAVAGGAGVAGAGGAVSALSGAGIGSNKAAGTCTIGLGNSSGNATQNIVFQGPPSAASGATTNTSVTIAQFSKTSTTAGQYSFVANATGVANATTAVDGYVYVGSTAGVPTGVPTAFTGANAITIDSTNNNMYFYSGSWLLTNSGNGKVTTATKTAATYAVLTTDSSTHFDNNGAGAQVAFNLPASAVGLIYYFFVATAQNVRIVGNGTDTIRIGASISAAGGRIDNAVVGSYVILVCHVAGQFVAEAQTVGTWTVT